METIKRNTTIHFLGIFFASTLASAVLANSSFAGSEVEQRYEKKQEKLDERHREYVYGEPDAPTAAWVISSGGRMYDSWMNALDIEAPKETHPSWPASNTTKKGSVTWRCKSCHGWDYKGVEGKYSEGKYKTGIKGVIHWQGTEPANLVSILRDATHKYTPAMISDERAIRIGTFISRGLHDADGSIDRKTGKVNGVASRGAGIFQNICASCHGFQGTKLDWGEGEDHKFVGTEANANPWEVLHKIRNGHPGVEMISMRAFPLETAVDILTYVKTLPEK